LSAKLFNPRRGLYAHELDAHHPDAAAVIYWGRAGGWIIIAMCDVLDVLPRDHPGARKVLPVARA